MHGRCFVLLGEAGHHDEVVRLVAGKVSSGALIDGIRFELFHIPEKNYGYGRVIDSIVRSDSRKEIAYLLEVLGSSPSIAARCRRNQLEVWRRYRRPFSVGGRRHQGRQCEDRQVPHAHGSEYMVACFLTVKYQKKELHEVVFHLVEQALLARFVVGG